MEGEDYCSTFLFAHGEPRAAMTYHNILEYPKMSGMGALRETVDAPEMETIGNAMLKQMKWHGVAQIDFRWDGRSAPWLIEINPRFWGGLAQSIESGWDFPFWLYQLAVDGHINPLTPERRYVRTKNPCLTALLAIQEFKEAESTGLDHSNRFRAAHKVFSEERTAIDELFQWDDPLPMLGLLYPLTVFMKHGKITPELLIAKATIQKKK
jgi:predicted ATP-grasp superfamily ATP-dependent carboligase